MKHIIGIMGAAGVGKDTAAEYISHTMGYRQDSFAMPIKRAIAALLDEPLEYMDRREHKETPIELIGVSRRQLQQTLGTEWGRNQIGPNLWVHLAEMRYEAHDRAPTVFSDVRFPNEVKWIKSLGGVLVKIDRPGTPGVNGHISEESLSCYTADVYIHNDRAPKDMYRELERELR